MVALTRLAAYIADLPVSDFFGRLDGPLFETRDWILRADWLGHVLHLSVEGQVTPTVVRLLDGAAKVPTSLEEWVAWLLTTEPGRAHLGRGELPVASEAFEGCLRDRVARFQRQGELDISSAAMILASASGHAEYDGSGWSLRLESLADWSGLAVGARLEIPGVSRKAVTVRSNPQGVLFSGAYDPCDATWFVGLAGCALSWRESGHGLWLASGSKRWRIRDSVAERAIHELGR